jgi:hypothetical protein
MKKLSVFVLLSLMLSLLSWAEKYEYVRLNIKGSSDIALNRWDYQYDSFTLNSGDVAKVIGSSKTKGDIYVNDGDGDIEFSHTLESGLPQMIVGPCTVKLAYHDQNAGYVSSTTFEIKRASDTGSTTLAWNGTEWEGSDDSQLADNKSNNSSPVPDPNGIKYDQLLGWCYFTDTPWIYSYTNGSWYYMHSMQDGIYVWNANLPSNGWMKLHG